MMNTGTSQIVELIELMDAGGFVVYLLLGLSFLVVMISLIKIFQFLQVGIYKGANADAAVQLYRQGKDQDAYLKVSGKTDIQSQLVARAIGMMSKTSQHKDDVRAEILRDASRKISYLQRYLRFLELVGSLAPLLGLFGTVLGMINAFQALEQAGNQVDPSILSGGIWVALLTTAAGLAVAMPTVTLFNYFDAKIESLTKNLDDLIDRLFLPAISEIPEGQSH